MKGTSLLAKICVAALLFGSAAWAESTSGLIDSTKLNDKKVTDLQGNELGKVDRLLVDPQSGQVRFAVIDVGGLLNQQGIEVAVPWQTLKVNREGGPSNFTVQLDASKEKLQSAPRFTEAEADRLFTPSGAEPVETYWTIIIPAPSSTASRPPEAGTTSPDQPSNVGQPSVSTPGEQGPAPSKPGSYYQQNRPSTAPSSTEQNNYPGGAQRPGAGKENQEGIPPKEETTTSPEPTTTPEPSTSIPSETTPTAPDKGDTKNGGTSFPGEPSTTP